MIDEYNSVILFSLFRINQLKQMFIWICFIIYKSFYSYFFILFGLIFFNNKYVYFKWRKSNMQLKKAKTKLHKYLKMYFKMYNNAFNCLFWESIELIINLCKQQQSYSIKLKCGKEKFKEVKKYWAKQWKLTLNEFDLVFFHIKVNICFRLVTKLKFLWKNNVLCSI